MKKSTLGERFKALRGERSLVTFSGIIGSNKTSWGQYENEKAWPALDLLIRIKERIGVDLNWLATGASAAPMPANLSPERWKELQSDVEGLLQAPNLGFERRAFLIVSLFKTYLDTDVIKGPSSYQTGGEDVERGRGEGDPAGPSRRSSGER